LAPATASRKTSSKREAADSGLLRDAIGVPRRAKRDGCAGVVGGTAAGVRADFEFGTIPARGLVVVDAGGIELPTQ